MGKVKTPPPPPDTNKTVKIGEQPDEFGNKVSGVESGPRDGVGWGGGVWGRRGERWRSRARRLAPHHLHRARCTLWKRLDTQICETADAAHRQRIRSNESVVCCSFAGGGWGSEGAQACTTLIKLLATPLWPVVRARTFYWRLWSGFRKDRTVSIVKCHTYKIDSTCDNTFPICYFYYLFSLARNSWEMVFNL